MGDLYTALADSQQLARGEEENLAGLTERVSPAPVVRVPSQPFEVNDLEGLTVLGQLLLGVPTSGEHRRGGSE